MSDNMVNVNTERMNNDISTLSDSLNNAKTEAKAIYEGVEALNGMWDGPANDSFAGQFRSDFQIEEKCINEMIDYIQLLTEDHKRYVDCENCVYEMVDHLDV